MKPIKLIIKTTSQKYPIIIGSNLISKLQNFLDKNSIYFNQCLLVIDKNISIKLIKKIKKSLKKKKIFIYSINANEKNKN